MTTLRVVLRGVEETIMGAALATQSKKGVVLHGRLARKTDLAYPQGCCHSTQPRCCLSLSVVRSGG